MAASGSRSNSGKEETKSNTLEPARNLLKFSLNSLPFASSLQRFWSILLEHKTPETSSKQVSRGMNVNSNELEVAPCIFPTVIEDIILDDYTANEGEAKGLDFPNMPAIQPQAPQFTLFGRPFLDLLRSDVAQLGNMILRGEENDVETVVARVRAYPPLLDIQVTVIDPRGTPVTGNLIKIAAMGGDVDLKEGIEDEKQRGIVERLKAAGGLSDERVADDLKCITSKEAKNDNKVRIKRYVDILIKFGESISEIHFDEGMTLKARQAKSIKVIDGHEVNLIDQLEKELQEEIKKEVHSGLVFDPRILQKVAQWFEENVNKRFGGWESDKNGIFWINGFGKLQSILSARDAQVVLAGIDDLVKGNKTVPARRLNNFDNSSYFYNKDSKLGADFYLGIYGGRLLAVAAPICCWARHGLRDRTLSKLMSSKNSSIANLCNIQQTILASKVYISCKKSS